MNPPLFVNLPRTISISELLPVGTFVYQVLVNNSYTWNATVPPKLSYSISQESTTCNVSWFTIDQDKGMKICKKYTINNWYKYSMSYSIVLFSCSSPASDKIIYCIHLLDNSPVLLSVCSIAQKLKCLRFDLFVNTEKTHVSNH